MLILPTRTPKQKPMPGSRIDWGHALARNLEVCLVLNDASGIRANSLVNESHFSCSFVNTPVWKPTPEGLGLDLSSASSSHLTSLSAGGNDVTFAGPITLVERVNIRTGSAFRCFLDHCAAAVGPIDFRTDNAATPLLNLTRNGAGGFKGFPGPAVTLNKYKTYGVTSRSGLVTEIPTFYIDGVAGTTGAGSGTGTGLASPSPVNFHVGRRGDGFVQMDGIVIFAYAWSRCLTTNEMGILQEDPYCFIIPPEPWRIYLATGGTPALVVSSASQGVVIT